MGFAGQPLPAFDAVVLAGGRSSRLDGEPKAKLVFGGQSLLSRTLAAVSGAERIAVAGPADLQDYLPAAGPACLVVREDPPFSGPAAAVAAALAALAALEAEPGAAQSSPPWTLVLACDMPGIAGALPVLLAEAVRDPRISVMARDAGGKAQPLAALYRTEDLRLALASYPHGLANLSMFRLLASVQWREVAVPEESTADVDTWADAGKWGISPSNRTV